MNRKAAALAAVLLAAVMLFTQGCAGSRPVEQGAEAVQDESRLAGTMQEQTTEQPGEEPTEEGEHPGTDGLEGGNTEDISAADASGPNASRPDTSGAGASGSDPAQTAASESKAASALETAGQSEGQGVRASAAPAGFACPSVTGALHVEGTQLTGSNGEAVQLRGISTHGLAWFPAYVNEACFRELRESWQANVIRLALYTAEYGGYCNGGNQEDLKQLVMNGVEYAARADMYVIIDWHILSDSNPNTHKEEARAFFAEMSARYAGETHVLYEICNEPNGNTSWSEIKSYAEEIIGVIRENDADAVILIGTPNWSQYVDQAAADPVTGYENLMYTLHFYAATHKEDLRSRMREAVEAGLPVFVSEYGICDASGNGGIDEDQANRWAEEMDRLGISYVAWNLSNKDETSAILKSSCGKTSGFSEDDLSASGQWLYRRLTGSLGGLSASADERADTSGPATASQPEAAAAQPETPAPQPETPAPQPEPAPPAGNTLTNGSFEITVTLVNSWEADGQPVYQYSLTLCNASGSSCTSWAVDVNFTGEIVLMDGWNGDYSAEGASLHITSKDYNGSLEAGASASDIGFIVSGGTIVP